MKDFDTVVVAVDFGGADLDGARWVARELGPRKVVLAHSIHVPEPPSFLKSLWGDEEQIEVSARAGADDRLEELAEQLGRETGVAFEYRVRSGPPAEQIAEVADSVDAELVVVGPHVKGAGIGSYLGSTAERLIHRARRPTLLATGRLQPVETILAAIDDSAVTAGILGWLERLAAMTGASLKVLHVIDNTTEMTYRAILAPRTADRRVELEEKAGSWLATRLHQAGVAPEAEALVSLGDPALEILATAERSGADLILMGTHGAGAAKRLLMGGVASLVIRSARSPVWLLPTPKD